MFNLNKSLAFLQYYVLLLGNQKLYAHLWSLCTLELLGQKH